jgi:hypothetical protein
VTTLGKNFIVQSILGQSKIKDLCPQNWSCAMNQFAILFNGRVPMGGFGQNLLTQTA